MDGARYAYAGNDPVNGSDRNGHVGVPCSPCLDYYDEDAAFDYDISTVDMAAMATSAIPVLEPLTDAIEDLNSGDYGWAVANVALAAVDTATLGADSEIAVPAKVALKGTRLAARSTAAMRSGFRKTLAEAGKLRAGDKAHHIVEQGDKFAEASRARLEHFGIDIHSAANGIGLSEHAGRHTSRYSQAVFNRIRNLKSKAAIENELGRIGNELRSYDKKRKKIEDWANDQLGK